MYCTEFIPLIVTFILLFECVFYFFYFLFIRIIDVFSILPLAAVARNSQVALCNTPFRIHLQINTAAFGNVTCSNNTRTRAWPCLSFFSVLFRPPPPSCNVICGMRQERRNKTKYPIHFYFSFSIIIFISDPFVSSRHIYVVMLYLVLTVQFKGFY